MRVALLWALLLVTLAALAVGFAAAVAGWAWLTAGAAGVAFAGTVAQVAAYAGGWAED